MTTCPLCAHPLYHQSPPLLRLPPLRVYCDGCQGWLAWQPTNETRRVQVAPLCPACGKPMALKGSARYSGLRWGCETWKKCKSGMRPESATTAIDVPVYQLVAGAVESVDEDAAHFAELDRATQKRKTEIEGRAKRYEKRWWNAGQHIKTEG